MKKSLLMTLSALMLGTLMLTGCGTEKTETTAQTSAETTTQTERRFGGNNGCFQRRWFGNERGFCRIAWY